MDVGSKTGHPLLYAAAVTPLGTGGASVDIDAAGPMAAFLESHGVDGVFACGTTGEGVLLDIAERRLVAEAFRSAMTGRLIVHAGAQTTAGTVALAEHAAEIGADGVAVIAPPYYRLDAGALRAHFAAAARACAPLPFYCYAFTARSGYPLPVDVVRDLAETVDNLAGLKVSESPWSAVAPYLTLGLPVLVGNEPLIAAGLRAGAVGAVSGMAAAYPDVVRKALDDPSDEAMEHVRWLRDTLAESGQFVAAAKYVLGRRGVPVSADVRAPLRRLLDNETAGLDAAFTALPRAGRP